MLFFSLLLSVCVQSQTTTVKEKVVQRYSDQKPTAHHKVALEVIQASKNWITSFNEGNIKEVLQGYAPTAVLSAMPFGIKNGIKDIKEFWTPFIKSGATNLVYTELKIEVVNETTAFLSANWSMNVGRGVIFQEKWKKEDGLWVLTYDNFEVLEQFETPQKNIADPIASHIALEEVIIASIHWIQGFNAGASDVCGNGYFMDATMNAVPFASINGKEGITGFWTELINQGATNLIYHNPIFKVITDNSVVASSQWSMNIGEGKIYQEKWIKKEGTWLLSYDEFQVLQQY